MGSWKYEMPEPEEEDDLARYLWEHRDEGADGPEVSHEREVDQPNLE
jgi:hypothetical protein